MVASLASAGAGPRDSEACRNGEPGLGGYDPVSYRDLTVSPQQGRDDLVFEHAGVRYLFATEENRERFERKPELFLPQYAGWCAMSLALGDYICPNYTNFKLQKGQLYLFEKTMFTDGRVLWDANPGGNRERADQNWQADAPH
jgi:YHS domain-containing protein